MLGTGVTAEEAVRRALSRKMFPLQRRRYSCMGRPVVTECKGGTNGATWHL
jgi:hypothetical protein